MQFFWRCQMSELMFLQNLHENRLYISLSYPTQARRLWTPFGILQIVLLPIAVIELSW